MRLVSQVYRGGDDRKPGDCDPSCGHPESGKSRTRHTEEDVRRTVKIYTAWTPGHPAQARFLTVLHHLITYGLVGEANLKSVPDGRCLAVLYVDRRNLVRVEQNLEAAALLYARDARRALQARYRPGEEFDLWVSTSLQAETIGDLVDLAGPMPAEAIISPATREARELFQDAYEHLAGLMEARSTTGPEEKMMAVLVAHGRVAAARKTLEKAEKGEDRSELQAVIEGNALQAAQRWEAVLASAMTMMPVEEDDPERDRKWALFDRKHLRRLWV